MANSNTIPFKTRKNFKLYNRAFEEGREYDLPFHDVEVLMEEGLIEILPLKSVDYLKLLKEERATEILVGLPENFFNFARISQKYLKDKSNISEKDKKLYSDSATALRNLLRLRAEKILKALLVENERIEVHEAELAFSSIIGAEISKWNIFKENIVKGEKDEAKL
jgi:hypothetical protein